MDNEELEKLLEELDGKTGLGLADEALALCDRILSEAEDLHKDAFCDLTSAVGMFADDVSPWRDRLGARYEALSKKDRRAISGFWAMFLMAADVLWEEVKPLVSLRHLPEDYLLKLSRYAIEAKDESWCSDALRMLNRICSTHSAADSHWIAYAALLCASGNYLAALDALQGYPIESHLLEDYFSVLRQTAMEHFLESLQTFEEQLSRAEEQIDSETELSLPGNDRSRFADLRQEIAKAKATTENLLRG